MRIDKAGTWWIAQQLAGVALVERLRRDSHTCCLGQREWLRDWGYGFDSCSACALRAHGWEA